MFSKPIHIGLSPNTMTDDYFRAVNMLLTPWRWKKGETDEPVEDWFRNYFSVHHAISFNAARSALFVALKALEIKEGDEVLLQAFTCVAVPNSVIWTGATPVYVDIDESFNIDIADAEKKLTSQTKAVIV